MVSSITDSTALDTDSATVGRNSPSQTSVRSRKPSIPNANSSSGTMAVSTWKEMALA